MNIRLTGKEYVDLQCKSIVVRWGGSAKVTFKNCHFDTIHLHDGATIVREMQKLNPEMPHAPFLFEGGSAKNVYVHMHSMTSNANVCEQIESLFQVKPTSIQLYKTLRT